MKALFIEEEALRNLVARRDFQSGEFEKALQLTNLIRNDQVAESRLDDMAITTHKEVTFVYSKKKINLNKAIIFDFNYLKDFLELEQEEFITVFQKILKCTLKSWEKLSFNNVTEKNISDNHIILFPFPYSNLNPFKVLLNSAPDSNYTLKRNMTYMYVANAGHGEFPLQYKKINIKAIKEEAETICIIDKPSVTNFDASAVIDSLSVTELGEITDKKNSYIDYDKWMHLLTFNQKKFVTKFFNGNERLEGAAGTGKTLTLVLRAIYLYRQYQAKGEEFHIIFVAHSIATKKHLQNMIQTHCPDETAFQRLHSKQSITITTLQEWCTEYLGNRIGISEVIDLDAQETKDSQILFLKEVYEQCLKNDFQSYKPKCSERFINFLENTDQDIILELLQNEISVSIKGRAKENFETYKTLSRLECTIPLNANGDYNFLFLVFEKYQQILFELGYFDNDDISLSALGQLDTPIWRRRRKEIGFDAILIDETHLFSYNELSLFHYLSKSPTTTRIIYAVDKTQAIGDRGLSKKVLEDSLRIETDKEEDTKYKTVFRSSPEIINLAFSVLTSGTNMFVNFENPLKKISFSFIDSEEKKSKPPIYILKTSDDDIIESAFTHADNLAKELACSKNNILITSTSNELLKKLEKRAQNQHKPCVFLTRRGDMEVVKAAEESKRYILGFIDYVGGLEFDGVIIIGVDKGRVPPMDSTERLTYQSYAWHNRMYVALTRAKYSVILIGNKSRTVSPFFENAIKENKIIVQEQ